MASKVSVVAASPHGGQAAAAPIAHVEDRPAKVNEMAKMPRPVRKVSMMRRIGTAGKPRKPRRFRRSGGAVPYVLLVAVAVVAAMVAASSFAGCFLLDRADREVPGHATGQTDTPSLETPGAPVDTELPEPQTNAAPRPGDLVDLIEMDDSFVVELRYATENNFIGKKVYSQGRCLLVRGTAEKLIAANREFAQMGYRLKIWDAYRPPSAQKALWEAFPDPNFVAPPERGSIHTRGAAVDVTLVDMDGNELPMPTDFDDFSEKAAIDYDGCTEEQAKNRELLAEIMVKHGFNRIKSEWWHFVDSDAASYPLLDVEFEDIE
ncbi:MAG TPA: D-alanyl-D-alanine dipeptidase [Firmicutes bacterium]|nr:D-alanyl-D-alanine dipeptidase [Candidatus Fermentithermobacillaceae bacterium]